MLFNLEQWILDKFEEFAHKSQRAIGIDCFGWARISNHCFLVCTALTFVGATLNNYPRKGWWISFIVLLFSFIWFLFRKAISETERQVRDNQQHKLANPMKRHIEIRLCYWVAAIWIAAFYSMFLSLFEGQPLAPLFWYIFPGLAGFSIFSMIYWISCDPLLPAKAKVKQYVDDLIGAIKEVFAPKPAFAPAPS